VTAHWTRWLRGIGILAGTVLVHELAHTVAALRVGAPVKEVAVGFGPRLFSRQVNGTTVSLRPILLGGFAAIDMEALPPERRAPVLLAGPFANLLVGLLLMPRRVTMVDPTAQPPDGLPPDGAAPALPAPKVQISGVLGALAMLARVRDGGALRSIAGQINLSVGLTNLLPLMPLDGGHLALAKMESRGVGAAGRDLFRHTTALLFLWLLLQVIAGDVRRLRSGAAPYPA
jgi:membrane-associated protease RseP (regulator of RpoE activity)